MSQTITNPNPGSEPVIKVRDLKIAFGPKNGATPTVHGVDFEIHAGECLAIVGESGSGKSVTARTLIGLTGANAVIRAQTLQLQGKDLRRHGERAWRKVRGADIGYVLQDALVSLDPLRPIGREIADSLRIHTNLSPAARTAKVLDLLEAVGIPEPEQRINQRSGELSGGLRQRALIAAAIALDPALLIADEPTTALDATVQQQILDLLAERKAAGTSLLLISHDLAVVGHLADRIAVMRRGEIVETGPTAQVLGNPQHEYTRRLLRAVPTDKPRGTRLAPAGAGISVRQHALIGAGRAADTTKDRTGPVLVAESLRKTYRNPDGTERVAVHDVSFALNRGQTLGIVGESGSGKSTVARMALGLAIPEAGEVRLLGNPWSSLPEKQRRPQRKHITSIYQDPLGSFDPQWDVARILSDALPDASRLSRAERRVEVIRLLETVGLDASVESRLPLRLSGGQRQRIAIARALAPGPDVIICDEPVSALDVSIQAQVLDLLDELQREFKLSYLFISHDLGVVQHVSDEIVVMEAGRVVEAGRTTEVFANPAKEYTRKLLAAAPRLATTTGGRE
ncbi:ABC transporter ATP-binding protein [Paeniglutamicibacter sp. ABSL32-1]|uniref:dipeptide ABC transporter ATP-binding protein n=1 Tax=Paeniglutamicibacter quisquiliarum TaxID=2849498 RepID=UPI001C2D0767|nr:ABC transporter ATP-binding protein [Paeniglutamicibacter quisquiliarum]MBV1777942.1 ABC transporter ATP-binding protein [Paeniglutamicibacter quisquiliarum]